MTTRRLAAIVAADIAGYSRLMHADEEGTHARFTSLMAEAVQPAVTDHGGRIVKSTGDGFLAEFGSAIEAVKAALQFQAEVAARSGSDADDKQIRFRVGIHVGDVIAEPADIFGDGVNIAARLEALAEPGGILVSGAAHDTVRGRVGCTFEDQGEQALKNIDRPVRAYRAVLEATREKPALALPDRPSIAVLPFQNMSGDPEQEYFADGMVDEIITGLSRVHWFFVISRNSSFTYKGRAVDIKQVGRELGVRYVLEGSIRKSANRVRITGQLIDATNGHPVWADRFDGDLADVFELQDRVTESVVGAIEPSLLTAEIQRAQAKPTESLDAYDLHLRALAHLYAETRADNDAALVQSKRANRIDPSYVPVKGSIILCYTQRYVQGWSQSGDREAAIALARECATEGRDDPWTLSNAGFVFAFLDKEREHGVALLERAMQLNPNSSFTLVVAGWVYCWIGRPEPALDCFTRALRLDPLGPDFAVALGGVGFTHLMVGRAQEGLEYSDRAIALRPTWFPGLRGRIVALMLLGREEEARETARHLLACDPGYRLSRGLTDDSYGAFRDTHRKALHDAGIPE